MVAEPSVYQSNNASTVQKDASFSNNKRNGGRLQTTLL